MFDRENNRLSHRRCNQRKGNRVAVDQELDALANQPQPLSAEWNAAMFPTTRDWFAATAEGVGGGPHAPS
jgi:hypothetical protein